MISVNLESKTISDMKKIVFSLLLMLMGTIMWGTVAHADPAPEPDLRVGTLNALKEHIEEEQRIWENGKNTYEDVSEVTPVPSDVAEDEEKRVLTISFLAPADMAQVLTTGGAEADSELVMIKRNIMARTEINNCLSYFSQEWAYTLVFDIKSMDTKQKLSSMAISPQEFASLNGRTYDPAPQEAQPEKEEANWKSVLDNVVTAIVKRLQWVLYLSPLLLIIVVWSISRDASKTEELKIKQENEARRAEEEKKKRPTPPPFHQDGANPPEL